MRAIVHGPLPIERHLQILFDTKVGKYPSPLGHIADAERRDAIGRPIGCRMAENAHRAVARMRETHQAAQRRRLAGAIAAEQRDDLAFAHVEADAMQDMALAVKGVQALGLQCHLAHAAAAVPR